MLFRSRSVCNVSADKCTGRRGWDYCGDIARMCKPSTSRLRGWRRPANLPVLRLPVSAGGGRPTAHCLLTASAPTVPVAGATAEIRPTAGTPDVLRHGAIGPRATELESRAEARAPLPGSGLMGHNSLWRRVMPYANRCWALVANVWPLETMVPPCGDYVLVVTAGGRREDARQNDQPSQVFQRQ